MANYIDINEDNGDILTYYTGLNENQLKRIYEPEIGLFVAESSMVIERALHAGYEPVSVLTSRKVLDLKVTDTVERMIKINPDIPIYLGSEGVLSEIRGYQLTRGILCVMKRKKLPAAADLLKETAGKTGRIVILNDVENPSNVGAIFRSAAALFMDGVLLTGDCADPLYRRAARVSVGTVFQIPWTYIESLDEVRNLGFKIAAMALSNDSVGIGNERLKCEDKLAIMLGNEGYGLPDEVVKSCDYTVKINMAKGVDSLNVAAASAVAFYELTR